MGKKHLHQYPFIEELLREMQIFFASFFQVMFVSQVGTTLPSSRAWFLLS